MHARPSESVRVDEDHLGNSVKNFGVCVKNHDSVLIVCHSLFQHRQQNPQQAFVAGDVFFDHVRRIKVGLAVS
jgi:hypothetical protein